MDILWFIGVCEIYWKRQNTSQMYTDCTVCCAKCILHRLYITTHLTCYIMVLHLTVTLKICYSWVLHWLYCSWMYVTIDYSNSCYSWMLHLLYVTVGIYTRYMLHLNVTLTLLQLTVTLSVLQLIVTLCITVECYSWTLYCLLQLTFTLTVTVLSRGCPLWGWT